MAMDLDERPWSKAVVINGDHENHQKRPGQVSSQQGAPKLSAGFTLKAE